MSRDRDDYDGDDDDFRLPKKRRRPALKVNLKELELPPGHPLNKGIPSKSVKHEQTEYTRQMVRRMGVLGIPLTSQAQILGINITLLNDLYEHDIKFGKHFCDLEVFDSLMDRIREGDTMATMFYLRTKGGWRTADKELEVQKAASQVVPQINISVSSETPDSKAIEKHLLGDVDDA